MKIFVLSLMLTLSGESNANLAFGITNPFFVNSVRDFPLGRWLYIFEWSCNGPNYTHVINLHADNSFSYPNDCHGTGNDKCQYGTWSYDPTTSVYTDSDGITGVYDYNGQISGTGFSSDGSNYCFTMKASYTPFP